MPDVIVVGARCAGAPTAMLLARRGHQVLLVDRASFPSDMAMSTHLIWQAGAAQLERWGLLDSVMATGCPPLLDCMLDAGPFTLTGVPPPVDGTAMACAPRRVVLDEILVRAAVAAGAELREGCMVDELLTDGERVTGIRAGSANGGVFEERARIVIGADGMHSKVAKLVQAPERHVRPPLGGVYFSYWSGVDLPGIVLYLRPGQAIFGWKTNDDLAMIGVGWPAADLPAVRSDIEGNYFSVIEQAAPALAERMREAKREARWIGGSVPNYVRTPYGPGWALVGDAGYLKDPCTAQGITDAFRDANLVADAVDTALSSAEGGPGVSPRLNLGLEAALADYERRRDEEAMAMYELTCQLASLEQPPPQMALLLAALAGNQAQTDRFFGIYAGSVAVQEFFSLENIGRILAAAH